MEVQIFGIKKSSDTRKALRFFSERRIKTHFVDLNERAASLGELRRFAQKVGVGALIDSSSAAFQDLGLRHARMSDDSWLSKLAFWRSEDTTRFQEQYRIVVAETAG